MENFLYWSFAKKTVLLSFILLIVYHCMFPELFTATYSDTESLLVVTVVFMLCSWSGILEGVIIAFFCLFAKGLLKNRTAVFIAIVLVIVFILIWYSNTILYWIISFILSMIYAIVIALSFENQVAAKPFGFICPLIITFGASMMLRKESRHSKGVEDE
ncbi:MAG: hypothetical protein IKF22_04230 [Lachnospiraceae bacterium]|jgi:hypothetical protein|nr:hypothetical protein [Lachnospiraceae bacterium]